MYKILLTAAFCLLPILASGQKANFASAEKFSSRRADSLLGTTGVKPVFFTDSDRFYFLYDNEGRETYYMVDPARRIKLELFDHEWIISRMASFSGRAITPRGFRFTMSDPAGDNKVFRIVYGRWETEFDRAAGTLTLIEERPTGRNEPTRIGSRSPDGRYMSYTENYNLFLEDLQTGLITQLSDDGERYYGYPMPPFMGFRFDENDYRAATGVWMADSRYFYILREDARKVGKQPIVDVLAEKPETKEILFQYTGDEHVPQFELWIFDAATKSKKRVDIDKWPDQSVRTIPSAPAGQGEGGIFFIRERRTRNEMELCRVDPATGRVMVLINEVGAPYLADELFSVNIINKGRDVLWWSERTGRGHYYRYDGDSGKLLNTVTAGNWTAGKVLRIDTAAMTLYFEGYGQVDGEAPYYMRMNSARIDRKSRNKILTPEAAMHAVTFSPSGKYFIDNYSRANLAPRTVLRELKGGEVMEVARADLRRLYATGWQMPEAFTAKAADHTTDLYGFMWKPYDFDPSRKYPIISYVYPGPQADHFPATFSVSGKYNAALAQLGFIVVTFGHRGGTPLRTREYHSYGYGNFRDYPLADDKYVLEQLAERYSFIDISRVGIFGHSGGGLVAATALLTYPEFYTAAVAASGNHDNRIYARAFTELYSGIEEKTTEVRKKIKDPRTGGDTVVVEQKTVFETSIPTPMELVSNLKGHLMLVTGDADNNVHPAHTLRLANALIEAGKNFELVVLPGERHVYSGAKAEFFERKVWMHFARYLLGDRSAGEVVDMEGF